MEDLCITMRVQPGVGREKNEPQPLSGLNVVSFERK